MNATYQALIDMWDRTDADDAQGLHATGEALVGALQGAAADLAEWETYREQYTKALEEADALRAQLDAVWQVFALQCPPNREDFAEDEFGRGAWTAHNWWNTVLGGQLAGYQPSPEPEGPEPGPLPGITTEEAEAFWKAIERR